MPVNQRTGGLLAMTLALLVIPSGCNSTNAFLNNQMGTAYYRQGNVALARDEFVRAIADDPQNSDYYHNLATVQRRLGQVAEAEHNYKQAINLNPTHQPSYHNLATLMNDQGRHAESLQLLQAWAGSQPYNDSAHVELAWMQRETGDYQGAEQSLAQAMQINPNSHIASRNLGQIYEDMGQTDRAMALYQRSLGGRWYQPGVHSRLALLERAPYMGGIGPQYVQTYPTTQVTNSIGSETDPNLVPEPTPDPAHSMGEGDVAR